MVVLADVRIRLESAPEWAPNLDSLADQLELLGAREARKLFPSDCDIDITVEEGSIKARLAVLGALYLAIGEYGDFRSGLQAVMQDARTLAENVEAIFNERGTAPQKVEIKPTFPGKLNRLLESLVEEEGSSRDGDRLEKARAQLEKLMSSVHDERERSYLAEQLPRVPASSEPSQRDIPSITTTIERPPLIHPEKPPPELPQLSDEFLAIVDDRRRRRKPERLSSARAPRAPRHRVHRRRKIGTV
jgi:hypothetical protein